MMSYRRKLSLLLFSCAAITTLLMMFFVNQTIHYQVDQYMQDNQEKRNERLVTYFEDLYQKNQEFNAESGIELVHEAYMNQYCLILMDADKNIIWGMSPESLRSNRNEAMSGMDGVYTAELFELEVAGEIIGYLEIGQHGSLLLSQADLAFKESIKRSMTISSLVTFTILIGLSLIFSKPLSKQMSEIAKMSRQLEKGQFDYRMKTRPNVQEMQVIEQGMNSLATQLQTQQTMRKQLVSDVSHELRTPLNILQTNLEGMLDGVIPVTDERLQYLDQEVIRFGKLISNLDLLKQFDTTHLMLNAKPLSMSHLVGQMTRDFEALCVAKNIDFCFKKQVDEGDIILGDEDQLKQVVLNLMSNALKFTSSGGEINLKILANSKQVILEVIDNGIGIEEADLSYVFERFYRADRSRNQTEGSGIGLSIVSEIMRLHGAKVELTSHLGQGTTARLVFMK